MAATVIGAYPPLIGSVFIGQVNLLVLAVLAPGIALVTRRPIAAGVAIGLAGVVKLVPLALALPLAVGARWRAIASMVATAGACLAIASLAAVGSGGPTGFGALFEPDPYWSNQSVNGFVSRLVLDSDHTLALIPHAVAPDLALAVVEVALAIGVVAVLFALHRPIRERPATPGPPRPCRRAAGPGGPAPSAAGRPRARR